MKPLIYAGAIATIGLWGCAKPYGGDSSPPAHGRYVGVGIYGAGRMWAQTVVANAPKNPAAAKLDDDEQIIVVVDSKTGELRQCGNLSGYCVAMNPWASPPAPSQAAPILLSKHADQLDAEATRAAAEADAAAKKDAKAHAAAP